MDRRHAIKLLSSSGLALYLSPYFNSPLAAAEHESIRDISPIDRTLQDIADPAWFSDYPERAHSVLWNKAGYMASTAASSPTAPERARLVIVGGGISGLLSAYLLKDFNPIILEQAPRFGGNSKGQSWRGIDYAMGAAYFTEPEVGSEIEKLLKDLEIDKLWRLKSGEDPVALNGKISTKFWDGSLAGGDHKAVAQFKKLEEYFKKVLEGKEIPFPDIPSEDPKVLEYVKGLDRQSFKTHLEAVVGGPLIPLIETAIEHYCWSSLGGSASEISAASGLNFYCAEFGGVAILPGGNAAIAERALERLHATLPANHLRVNSLVYDVTVSDKGTAVSYQDGGGKNHTILSDTVLMACPKFVVGKVLSGIEPERLAAIARIKYRAYLVANVCLQHTQPPPFYDLYLLGNGTHTGGAAASNSNEQKVTDVIYATYAKESPAATVLTLYRGFPYDGARGSLLIPDSYRRYRDEFMAQIRSEILPLLKLDSKQIVDLRIARWGHPLPLAGIGLIAEGVTEKLRHPFRNSVFFAEQDNWALPAFETAASEALYWSNQIRQRFESKAA